MVGVFALRELIICHIHLIKMWSTFIKLLVTLQLSASLTDAYITYIEVKYPLQV